MSPFSEKWLLLEEASHVKRRQTMSNDAKRRHGPTAPHQSTVKHVWSWIGPPKLLEILEVFTMVLPEKGPLENLLKFKTCFETLCLLCLCFLNVLFRSPRPKRCVPYLGTSRCRFWPLQRTPITLINLDFTTVKRTFLIKRHFEYKDALEGALRSPLAVILVFCFFLGGGAPFGVFAG